MQGGGTSVDSPTDTNTIRRAEYRKKLETASNYYDFVSSIIESARAGDSDAQYYLSEALNHCNRGYRAYFERPGHTRTVDEALQWASVRPTVNIDDVGTSRNAGLRRSEYCVLEERGAAVAPVEWEVANTGTHNVEVPQSERPAAAAAGRL